LIANTIAVSTAAPAYAPDGRELIATSVLAPARSSEDLVSRVEQRLATIYGLAPDHLALVARYTIDHAVPAFPPGSPLRKPVRIRPRRYICGDWRDTPSIQGALVSGRRAAKALLVDARAGST
jgi:hypothetical protein